jgi:hypothetical protein
MSSGADTSANLQTLRALNLLELGGRSEYGDNPSPEVNHDIARLEAKVDMLLSMIGLLVAEKSLLPPIRRVCFSVESISATLDSSARVGDAVVVAIYLNTELPRPLVLPAVVSSRIEVSDAAADLAFDLAPLDAAVRDEFERYIFLRHRRKLAGNASKSP